MRHSLAILLLTLLPLQFSWSAVITYCAHEVEVGAQQHFGHHEHVETSADIDRELESDGESTGLSLDCGHGNCCNVASATNTHSEVAIASRPYELSPSKVRTVVPDPPYRPQWFSFA